MMEMLENLWPRTRFRLARTLLPLLDRLPLPAAWQGIAGVPVGFVAAVEVPAREAGRDDFLDGSTPARLQVGVPVTVDLLRSTNRALCHAEGQSGAVLAHDSYQAQPPTFLRLRDAIVHPRWGIVQTVPGTLLLEAVHATRWFSAMPSGLKQDPVTLGGGPLAGFAARGGRERYLSAGGLPRIDGRHLLLGHWAAHNFGHFHMDCLPGPLLFADELRAGRMKLLARPLNDWQRALLARLDIPHRAVREVADDRVEVEDLVVPLSLDCRYTANAHPVHRELFRTLAASARPTAGPSPPRLYVNRGSVRATRSMQNEPLLVAELERRGFVSIDPGAVALDDQVRLFSRAEIVVGPLGAALTNLGYAPAGCAVVEILPAPVVETWIAHLCGVLGHRFVHVVAPLAPTAWRSVRVGDRERADVEMRYETPLAPTLAAVDALLEGRAGGAGRGAG